MRNRPGRRTGCASGFGHSAARRCAKMVFKIDIGSQETVERASTLVAQTAGRPCMAEPGRGREGVPARAWLNPQPGVDMPQTDHAADEPSAGRVTRPSRCSVAKRRDDRDLS